MQTNNNGVPGEGLLSRLPGYNCGLCGQRTCVQFSQIVLNSPQEIKRCVFLSESPGSCAEGSNVDVITSWKDSLGREYDFVLDSLPGDQGPRETILAHNPARVKDLGIKPGDTVVGRPMGMSCGCPITHCGVAIDVDPLNGVLVWCVTGPLAARSGEYKDIGYYSAQAYEGIVTISNKELKIGMRYWFLPYRCMLQWRHSGLVNAIVKKEGLLQVRVEGLMIG